MQKLITKEIERALEKQGDTSQLLPENITVFAKFFSPGGRATWYLYDWDRETRGRDGDFEGFPPRTDDYPNRLWVFAILNDPELAECGTILLSELESVRVKPFNLPIERDIHFSPMPLSDVMRIVKGGGHV